MKKQKNNLRQKIMVALAGILMLSLSFFLMVENFKFFKKDRELAKKVNNYSKELTKLENSNNNLREKIENYDDKEYIEKIAREEENLKKSGENVVSFVLPDNAEKINADLSNGSNNILQKIIASIWGSIQNIFK